MHQHTSYHFILIEDSPLDSFIGKKIILDLGSRCLSFSGFFDPQEALAYMKDREVQEAKTIVFLDIQMPLMTGFEFIEAYEQLVTPEKKAQYIINVLSSSISEKDIMKALSYSSINKFLHKPWRKEMIRSLLEELEQPPTEN